MLITNIRQTSPGRLTVCLEDGSEIKTTLGTVTDLRLFSGRELDEEQLDDFLLSSRRSLARERALELLSQRPMSRQELIRKLMEKGEEEEVARYCADWLTERGMIDDESYARALGRHYAAKGYGAGRLKSELSRRGIDRELWDEAAESMPLNSGKLDRFISSRLKDPQNRDQVRKVCAALYRRGFSRDDIRDALERFHAQAEYEE